MHLKITLYLYVPASRESENVTCKIKSGKNKISTRFM